MKKTGIICFLAALFIMLSVSVNVFAGNKQSTSSKENNKTEEKGPSDFAVVSSRKGQIHISWTVTEGKKGAVLYVKIQDRDYIEFATYEYSDDEKKFDIFLQDCTPGEKYTFKVCEYTLGKKKKIIQGPFSEKSVKVSKKNAEIAGGDYEKGSIYGPELSESGLKAVKNKVKQFLTRYIDDEMQDYFKVMYAHDYLCQNVICIEEGDEKESKKNSGQSAYSALVSQTAVSSGYARAFKALCDGMGIGCEVVSGKKEDGSSYEFNMVKVSKKWYIVDVFGNAKEGYYANFLVSTRTFKKTGISFDDTAYPTCKKNYPVK